MAAGRRPWNYILYWMIDGILAGGRGRPWPARPLGSGLLSTVFFFFAAG